MSIVYNPPPAETSGVTPEPGAQTIPFNRVFPPERCGHEHGTAPEAITSAVECGRDADSIAATGAALAGALDRLSATPADWHADVSTASGQDFVMSADAHLAGRGA
jgi:hypothetical protein